MCWIRERHSAWGPRFDSWRGVEERSYTYVKLEIVIIIIIFSKTVLSTKNK